jgi:4,5-dihydroxyphthalate decarboxylase
VSVRVPLSLACWDYDRTLPLRDGRVPVAGVDLTYLELPVEETFFRMARFHEFDAAEMSLSSYVLSLGEPDPPFVAIPVFPSRAFRHNGIYVNSAAGIKTPADLAGRVVGVPEYQVTAAVWIRGILAEHHGVPVASVHYRTGGLHESGRIEKLALRLPDGIRVEPVAAGATLAQLLAEGGIEALYSPRTPRPFAQGDPRVRRLFGDPRMVEEEYFARTGIFPIMHTVVLRREVYERRPWLARPLFTAFDRARRETAERQKETAAASSMLPWLYAEAERTRRLMGEDFWPYGLEQNRTTLTVFLRYAHEQGLTNRLLEPEELFAPETLLTHAV